METLNQKMLKELLHYDPETGVFTWIKSTNFRIHIGDVAGCPRIKNNFKKAYVDIGIFGHLYLAHRLAFLYMTGLWPINYVDHEDGNGLHNWWSNLRDVTRTDNNRNCKKREDNKSGFTGVTWCKHKNKWSAQIRGEGKQRHIGYYLSKEDAIAARKAAEIQYKYHPNHGQERAL